MTSQAEHEQASRAEHEQIRTPDSPRVRTGLSGTMSGRLRRVATLAVLPVGMLLVWQVVSLSVDSVVFVGPVEAISVLADDLAIPRFRNNVLATVHLLFFAFLAAVVVGATVGFLIGLMSFWHRVIRTLMYSIYSIPKVTLYPILLLFVGIGDASRFTFTFLHGFFPMALIVLDATANVDRTFLKLAAANRLGPITMMRKILIPAVLPALFTGMRLAFALAMVGMIVAEMFSSNSGIGYELVRNIELVRVERMVGILILIACLAVPPTLLLRWLELRIDRKYGKSDTVEFQ